MGNEPADKKDVGKKTKNVDASKKPEPCCECCCAPAEKAKPDFLRGETIFENRSCTDCCFWPIYIICLIGWIIVISVATATGQPERIIKPENFRGELCGDGVLVQYPAYFVPLPSRPKYGYCVKTCPKVGDIVCNNDLETDVLNSSIKTYNHIYSHTKGEFSAGAAAAIKCRVSCGEEQKIADRYIALQLKLQEKKCLPVFYPSAPSLLRCIPGKSGSGEVNTTLSSLANESTTTITELGDALGVGAFFQLGFAEVLQTWRVILICAFTAMAISFIWVYLLKWILAPIIYFCLILVLAVLIGLGFVFKAFADDLEKGALPGEKGTDDQMKIWRACEYVFFLLAAIYLVVMLNMLERIRIAIAVMKEASKAFLSAPSMGLVPLITFVLLLGFAAFFIVTTVYIQTMGSEAQETLNTAARSVLGDTINLSEIIAGQNNSALANLSTLVNDAPSFNVSQYTTLPQTKVLHMFNFFMLLWTGNLILMFGFMTMAMVVCNWYFSATQQQLGMYRDYTENRNCKSEAEVNDAYEAELQSRGIADPKEMEKAKAFAPKEEKSTVALVVPRAAWATFANHMGTVMFGSLLIAIIQFIRAIFTYLADKYLKENELAKDSWWAKALIYCIECVLWYIEQVIKIVSKNAFIITAIKNTSFCSSAFNAIALLVANMGRLAILTFISTTALLMVKVFIVGCNFFIAYGLMMARPLTEDRVVESGLFPMIFIFVLSYTIASLFLNVYEACIDTIFMAFLIDEDELNGEYMPEALSSIVGMFTGAEEARLAYEKQMRDAMNRDDSEPTKK